jgi:hypothetical protein
LSRGIKVIATHLVLKRLINTLGIISIKTSTLKQNETNDDTLVFAIAPGYGAELTTPPPEPINRLDFTEATNDRDNFESPFQLIDRPLYAEKIIRQTTGKYTLPSNTSASAPILTKPTQTLTQLEPESTNTTNIMRS